MTEVKAKWSGSFPSLCHGEWTLIVDGRNVSDYIPDELRNSSMNTFGVYSSWHFEGWMEVFDDYTDGLMCDEWIEANKYWLDNITRDYVAQVEIFNAINKEDFRSGSCGGCI